jgi:hypothetical protein
LSKAKEKKKNNENESSQIDISRFTAIHPAIIRIIYKKAKNTQSIM